MAKKTESGFISLPMDTIIEVVSIKGEKVLKNEMTYKEALNIKAKNGWKNIIYQKGFCTIKENK